MMPMAVLGGSGRLARLLRPMWPVEDAALWISRAAAPGVVQCDMMQEQAALIAHLHGCRAVLCLAGATGVAGQAMSLNVTLARAALDAAARAGVSRVFLASSAAVYGSAEGDLDEEVACAPLSEYGRAKLEMEKMGRSLGPEIGVRVTSLRIGNVAGADAILGRWRAGFELDQFADQSTPCRSYIGPATLARVLSALGHLRNLPEVINVAAPGAVEMGALLDAAGLAWTPRRAPASAIPNVTLSTDRLQEYVAIPPGAGTPDALVREWHQANTVTA